MSTKPATDRQLEDEAINQARRCWLRAIDCLHEIDSPPWKRAQNALRCFKGLPLDHLPRKLDRSIDITFSGVNAILARYTISTWDDYQKISNDDLKKIETLIRNLI